MNETKNDQKSAKEWLEIGIQDNIINEEKEDQKFAFLTIMAAIEVSADIEKIKVYLRKDFELSNEQEKNIETYFENLTANEAFVDGKVALSEEDPALDLALLVPVALGYMARVWRGDNG